MEASVQEYIDELKKNIKYWEGYRNNTCVPIADDTLRNIMINTLDEIIQNRQVELKEWIMDLDDLDMIWSKSI